MIVKDSKLIAELTDAGIKVEYDIDDQVFKVEDYAVELAWEEGRLSLKKDSPVTINEVLRIATDKNISSWEWERFRKQILIRGITNAK